MVFNDILPWKMSESFLNASSFSVPNGANRAKCVEFFNFKALVSYVAAWVDVSAEEITVMLVFQ